MKERFQPSPRRMRANQKLAIDRPERPVAAAAAISTSPAAVTRSLP
jgi:hypothetical protein